MENERLQYELPTFMHLLNIIVFLDKIRNKIIIVFGGKWAQILGVMKI
jgi:hypothetical protein